MEKTKQCPRCKKVLPITDFGKDSSRKSELYPYCKSCNYNNSRLHRDKKKSFYASYGKQYRLDHIDALREYGREKSHVRYLNNKDLYREYNRIRRIRIRGGKMLPIPISDYRRRINELGNKCIYCGGEYQHLDHLIPLSSGGLSVIENLVTSCSSCNLSKSSRRVISWFRDQPFYSVPTENTIISLLLHLNTCYHSFDDIESL